MKVRVGQYGMVWYHCNRIVSYGVVDFFGLGAPHCLLLARKDSRYRESLELVYLCPLVAG